MSTDLYRPPAPPKALNVLEEELHFIERTYKLALHDSSLTQHLAEACSTILLNEMKKPRHAELRGFILRNLQRDFLSYRDEAITLNPQRLCNFVLFMGVIFKRVLLDSGQPMKVLIQPLYFCLFKLSELSLPYDKELKRDVTRKAVKILHAILLTSGKELLLFGDKTQMEELMNNITSLLVSSETASESRADLLEILESRWRSFKSSDN